MTWFRVVLAAMLLVMATPHVFASSISLKKPILGEPAAKAIWIEGDIQAGDYERLKQAAKTLIASGPSEFLIYLDSPGGDVNEAMRMGLLARELLATTLVVGNTFFDPESSQGKQHLAEIESKTGNASYREIFGHYLQIRAGESRDNLPMVRCYSACVLLFWGGVKKDISDNSWLDSTGPDMPVMGLHRAFYDQTYFKGLDPTEAYLAFERPKDAVSVYLQRMGAPNDLVDRMYRTASSELELVPAKQFSGWFAREEPYYHEWLEARCANAIPEFFRKDTESQQFVTEIVQLKMEEAKRRAVQNGTSYSEELPEAVRNYMPPGYSETRYNNQIKLSAYYSKKRLSCLDSSATSHRLAWAKKPTH